MTFKTINRKIKIEQHVPHKKTRVNSGAPGVVMMNKMIKYVKVNKRYLESSEGATGFF